MMDNNCIMSSCSENKQATTTYRKVDDSNKHNTEEKNPDTKKYMQYGCIYVTKNRTKLTYDV